METPPTGPQPGDAEAHTSFAGAALRLVFRGPPCVLPICWGEAGVAVQPLRLPAVVSLILSCKGSCQKPKCSEAQGWGPMEGVDGLFALFHLLSLGLCSFLINCQRV